MTPAPGPAPATREVVVASLDDQTLAALFTRVYQGYPVATHLDAATVRFMVRSFDLDRDASPVLLEDGAPVALAMLGRRGEHGWIGGMGVVAEARGRGHGRRVMAAAIARARALGVTTLDLEVLVQNAAAIPLYVSLGFAHTRDLEVWRLTPPAPVPGVVVTPVTLEVARAAVVGWRREPEPWQRADATLERFLEQGLALDGALARVDGRAVGAMVSRLAGPRVSVVQLAVQPGAETRVVPALLAALARPETGEGIRWLNLPAGGAIAAVVRGLAAGPEERQHEIGRRRR